MRFDGMCSSFASLINIVRRPFKIKFKIAGDLRLFHKHTIRIELIEINAEIQKEKKNE